MTHPARAMQRAQERQLRREGRQQLQQLEAPPTAGAIDLGALKGGDPARQQQVADAQLKQNGFLCNSCGGRMRDESIVVVGYNLGQFPEQRVKTAPNGQPIGVETVIDDGCQFFTQAFCSRSCPGFVDALANGIDPGEENRANGVIRPNIVAIRHLPAVEWLDEVETAEAA